MKRQFQLLLSARWLVWALFMSVSVWRPEHAEAAALIGDQVQAQPGEQGVDYGFTLEVAPGERVAALQFELHLNNAFALESLVAGAVAQAANKSVSLNELGPGRYRVIVAGLNQNEIAPGRLIEGALRVGLDAPGGAHEVGIERLVISSPTGASVVAEAQPGAVFVDRADPTPPEQCGCAGVASAGNNTMPWNDAALLLTLLLVLLAASRKPRHQV